MIGKLKGTVDEAGEDHVVVDVHGVGYIAYCGARTLAALPPAGEAVVLFVDTYVREDALRLYGFSSASERGWFRLLQNVQGVGAKVALAVVGTLSPNDLANAVALQDKAMVARAPGVGPRVAARIVAELKDKLPSLAAEGASGRLTPSAEAGAAGAAADAVSALANLGYSRDHAAAAVAAALKKSQGADVTSLIRLGLKELSR